MFVPSLISLTCHLVLYFASNTVLTFTFKIRRFFLKGLKVGEGFGEDVGQVRVEQDMLRGWI